MADIFSIVPFAINFGLVVVIIFFLAKKPARKLVYQRHEHLKDFVEASAQELDRSRARAASAATLLGGAEREAREIARLEASATAAEVEAVILAAKQESARIDREALTQASAFALDADEQMKAAFVDLILLDATEKMRAGLRKDDHSAIMRRAESSIGAGV